MNRLLPAPIIAVALALALAAPAQGAGGKYSPETPRTDVVYEPTPPAPLRQTPGEVLAKSRGCMTCHTKTEAPSMHRNPAIQLGCTDCHGGDASVNRPEGEQQSAAAASDGQGDRGYSGSYRAALDAAHVTPTMPNTWKYPSSANPEVSYTLLNKEAPEYVRFVNPSDYRVAREACGACHLSIIQAAERSLMSTGAMLWGGAAYNNGILPFKNYIVGEAYNREGDPVTIMSRKEPDEKMKARGILPFLTTLPAWEVIPGADVFRVFERGGRNILNLFPETIALPSPTGLLQRLEEPGRPDLRQSNRGPGTGLRVAIPVLNIHKSRLNDPFMWFLGTNEQPGDFRSSGCAGCHVVYANSRDERDSGPYAKFGNMGETQTKDPTIPHGEPGHPLGHEFTRAIPTSLCMNCHMHQPNVFVNPYLGYTMWDYESDAPAMWPEEQQYPTHEEIRARNERNPEEAAARGKWHDINFLKDVWLNNDKLEHTQFADYHGHGWNFRAIFKKDRKGNLLDAEGNKVSPDDPNKFKKAVHMASIHADVGMHCVDCHFAQDSHGNGWIVGEVANAVEIRCKDCHGTAERYPSLRTSGPAARPGGNDLSLLRVADGRKRFVWRGSECNYPINVDRDCKLYQRPALWGTGTTPTGTQKAALGPELEWEVSLVKDSVNPNHAGYNKKSARAKLMSKGTSMKWGPGIPKEQRAHTNDDMMCFTCHLSWTTSCAGCHLPIQANWLTERHHFEGGITRNYATYNPQVARDQMFQLGIHSTVKGNTIAPIRSSSALTLSSRNINRELIYIQQPPVAASGHSSQAFAPHFPHTVRKTETKTCSDCHVSENNDNNAIMAQLLLHGTNFVNFVGYMAWVGGEGGLQAVRVTEWEEPQAVIGSYLHRYAYPDWYQEHQDRGRELYESYTQRGNRTGCLQMRGEYLYAAEGPDGMMVYDIASIANKGFSDRIIEQPFGILGYDARLESENATCVVLPTNQPIHPDRFDKDEATKKLMMVDNQEQPWHPIYDFAFITDSVEGLILTDVNTFSDLEPRNNGVTRALTWNENGVLDGAKHLTIAGYYFYIAADAGIVVLNMNDPMNPKLESVLPFDGAEASALQFRYLFVTDRQGFHVVDATNMAQPKKVAGATIPLAEARRIYVARTYAYVAAGSEGLAIIDVERPDKPWVYMKYTADGRMTNAYDVMVGSTNASLYAYVADGEAGLKVVHLTSPDKQPRFYGFSPEPKPELIAWWKTKYPAISLSKGLDRDRAVDETGGQIAILGRLGSRPFTQEEMQDFYLDENGNPWFVSDTGRPEDYNTDWEKELAQPMPSDDASVLGSYIVYFDFDDDGLSGEARATLEKVLQDAKAKNASRINIFAFTDAAGNNAYNQSLSRRRAASAAAYLRDGGFDASKMSYSALGEGSQRVATADGVRESENRRVELRLVR